jgi:hypothetical protein
MTGYEQDPPEPTYSIVNGRDLSRYPDLDLEEDRKAAARELKSARVMMTKSRDSVDDVQGYLAIEAMISGYRFEELVAPFPRGHECAAIRERKNALARIVVRLYAARVQIRTLASATGLNDQQIIRLIKRGLALATPRPCRSHDRFLIDCPACQRNFLTEDLPVLLEVGRYPSHWARLTAPEATKPLDLSAERLRRESLRNAGVLELLLGQM